MTTLDALQRIGTVHDYFSSADGWVATVGIDTARIRFSCDHGPVRCSWVGLPVTGEGDTPDAAFIALQAVSHTQAREMLPLVMDALDAGSADHQRISRSMCVVSEMLQTPDNTQRAFAYTCAMACVLLGMSIDAAGAKLASALMDASIAAVERGLHESAR